MVPYGLWGDAYAWEVASLRSPGPSPAGTSLSDGSCYQFINSLQPPAPAALCLGSLVNGPGH